MVRFRVVTALAYLLCGLGVARAQDKPLARFDEPGQTKTLPKEVGNVGFRFTSTAPFTIAALGYYDVSGHSMVFSHPVAIFDDKGKEVEHSRTLVSPKAPLGTDGFRWATIKPLALKAGAYTISASVGIGSGPDNVFTRNVKGLKMLEGFTYGGAVSNAEPVFGVGDTVEPSVSYFGPNLKVVAESQTVPPATPTPPAPTPPLPVQPTPTPPLPTP